MRRADIVRVQLPPPVGGPGREQVGTRPAIVVQDERMVAGLSTVVVVPVTSRLHAARFPGSFTVQPSESNGLDVASVVLTHQVRAVDARRVERVIGTLDAPDMAILEQELRRLLRL